MTVADRWFQQYQFCLDQVMADGRTARAVHRALVALGPLPSQEDVDKVIGNPSWII